MILIGRLRKLCSKKFNSFFDMNDKRNNVFLLRILKQIQQDNVGTRNGINKSVATICKEEGSLYQSIF